MAEVTALDARKGMLLSVDGRMCRLVQWNIWKSDRRSRIQMKLKEMLTGRTSEITAQPDDRFDVLDVTTIELEHSYRDGAEEVFYTPDGEEWRCSATAVEDVLRWKADQYEGLLVEGKLLTVNPPQSVVAQVVETTPSIRGVQNGLKDAVLDNGLTVKVGMVINIGDKVRIDTGTMEYKERVS